MTWARPTKVVSAAGKPCRPPIASATADRSTAVTIAPPGAVVQPRYAMAQVRFYRGPLGTRSHAGGEACGSPAWMAATTTRA